MKVKYSDSKNAQQAVIAAALDYAERRGWYVLLVGQDKVPCFSGDRTNGRNWGNTRDAAEIERYFRLRPRAMLGLACGEDSGVIVIECDTKAGHDRLAEDGAARLAALEAEHGKLPDTLMAISPTGSVHRYFRWPGVFVPSRNGKHGLGEGIDTKADGGYVVLPPSVRSDGAYRWLNDLPPAELPPAWLALLTSEREPSTTGGERAPSPVTPPPTFVTAAHAGRGVSDDPDDLPQRADDDEVIFALNSIPPHEISNDEWFRLARALLDHFGEDGFEHFDEWCDWSVAKYGRKAKSPRQQWRDTIRSRDRGEAITVGTIFHYANEYAPGWREAYRNWKESQ